MTTPEPSAPEPSELARFEEWALKMEAMSMTGAGQFNNKKCWAAWRGALDRDRATAVADELAQRLIELADELDMELDGGAKWTKAQHTCASVSGAMRDVARKIEAAKAELRAALKPSPSTAATEALDRIERALLTAKVPYFHSDHTGWVSLIKVVRAALATRGGKS